MGEHLACCDSEKERKSEERKERILPQWLFFFGQFPKLSAEISLLPSCI